MFFRLLTIYLFVPFITNNSYNSKKNNNYEKNKNKINYVAFYHKMNMKMYLENKNISIIDKIYKLDLENDKYSYYPICLMKNWKELYD